MGTSGKGTKVPRPQRCCWQGRNGPGGNVVFWVPRQEGFRERPRRGVTCAVARAPWKMARAAPPSGQPGLALTCLTGAGTASRTLWSPLDPACPQGLRSLLTHLPLAVPQPAQLTHAGCEIRSAAALSSSDSTKQAPKNCFLRHRQLPSPSALDALGPRPQ